MMSSTYNRMKREMAELERQLEGYKIGAEEEAAEADRLRTEMKGWRRLAERLEGEKQQLLLDAITNERARIVRILTEIIESYPNKLDANCFKGSVIGLRNGLKQLTVEGEKG